MATVGLVVGRCDYVHEAADSKARSVKLFRFDTATGDAEEVRELATGINPSWVTVCGDMVYCTNETVPQGRVEGYKLTGEQVSSVEVGGAPCHLLVDTTKQRLYSANYCGGDVTCFTLESGKLCSAVSLPAAGSVPSDPSLKDRQEAPHPHHVCYDIHGNLAVSDLGTDRVDFIKLTSGNMDGAAGSLTLHTGAGPRRILRQEGFIYVLNELTQGITVVEERTMTLQGEEVKLLPSDVTPLRWHHRGGSEIVSSPCGGYVLAATRTTNEIVVFSRDPTSGGLTFVSRAPSGGTTPRHFTFCSGWLLASCHAISPSLLEKQHTDLIAIFKFEAGQLTHHKDVPCEMAACIDFIDASYL